MKIVWRLTNVKELVDRTRKGEYEWRVSDGIWVGDYKPHLCEAGWTLLAGHGRAFEVNNKEKGEETLEQILEELKGDGPGDVNLSPLYEEILLGEHDFQEMEEVKLTNEW